MFLKKRTREEVVNNIEPWSLVEITWRDAYDASNGWTEVGTYKPEDQIAVTVGYVWVDCQKHYITLCGTFFLQELPKVHTIGNVTHVPIAMIQSLRVINKQQKLRNILNLMGVIWKYCLINVKLLIVRIYYE